MKLSLIEDWASLRQRADEWNALAARAGIEGTFASLEWCDALRKAHYKGGPAPTLIVEDSGRLVAVWPLHLDRLYLGKLVPCRRLSDHGAWHTGHNGLICGADHEAVAVSMLDYLRREFRAWDTLEVVDLIQDSPSHQALLGACAKLNLPVNAEPGKRSPFLPITQSWESYVRSRSSKFLSSLRRNESALNRMGRVDVVFLRGAGDIKDGLEAVMAIERQSWKQQAGSAITARGWEQTFYEAYLPRAAERGAVSLAIMRLDGRAVAYRMGLIQDNRYSSLKTSYVNDVRAVGPGKVMTAQVIRSVIAQGLTEYDFLGEAEPWKMEWTETFRPHVTLRIYRNQFYARLIGQLQPLRRRLSGFGLEREALGNETNRGSRRTPHLGRAGPH